jgi:hypothetical protein
MNPGSSARMVTTAVGANETKVESGNPPTACNASWAVWVDGVAMAAVKTEMNVVVESTRKTNHPHQHLRADACLCGTAGGLGQSLNRNFESPAKPVNDFACVMSKK